MAVNQLLIVTGMCAMMDAARPSKYATQALWRELAVLFELCGFGW